MATLSTSTISAELRDKEGYYFEGQTIASATALTSSAIYDGEVQGAIEIVGEAATEITIADTKTLKVELQSASTEDGSYTTFATPYDVTSSGGTTVTAGTELFRTIVPTDAALYIKAKITTDATNAGTVDIFDLYISR